jgi:hypothetical protein
MEKQLSAHERERQVMDFLATFPIFALQHASERQGELLAVQHPETGQKTVFVFTEEDEAHQFADKLGRCKVIKLAEDPDAFQRALSSTDNEVVAFDPVIRDSELQVKFQTLVSTILR